MADVRVTGAPIDGGDQILTPAALAFLVDLHQRFGKRRNKLLAQRPERRAEIAGAGGLDFRPESQHIRDAEWTVAPAPPDLVDRRVEITGPTERKMAINALNSGAKVWLADLEDANTPHWANVVAGQVNLTTRCAARSLRLPRGQGTTGSATVPGSLCWSSARAAGTWTSGTWWSTASRWSALLWTSACTCSTTPPNCWRAAAARTSTCQRWRATSRPGSGTTSSLTRRTRSASRTAASAQPCSSRRSPAAFEMDEILYELRDHMSGLNAGRWDYLFSVIKNFRDAGPEFVLPDRAEVTMTAPFMRAYTELLVATCHRRGAFAMGGMAAFIPSRRDPRSTSGRSRRCGRTRSGRPATVSTDRGWPTRPRAGVRRRCSTAMLGDRPNQLDRRRDDVQVTAADLLDRARDARARSTERACARTSRWRCGTSRPGWAATERSRSTT